MGYFKTFGTQVIYSGSKNKPATGDVRVDISDGGDKWGKYDGSAWSTGSVFDTCPAALIRNNPAYGFEFFEDFSNLQGDAIAQTNLDGWTVTQSTTGAVDPDHTVPYGVLLMDSASTTVTQGVQIQYCEGTLPFKPAADKDIWFECRLKIVDDATKAEFFAGLAAVDTTILATSANSSANHIGWQCVTDNGVLLFSAEKATAGATKASTTLVEDTYITLGFHVHGVTSIDHYINGVKQSTSHVTANVPVVGLTPSFVIQSDGTHDPILHLDYVRCIQIR